MWQIIFRFGFLASAILLLVLVGEYALFLKPRAYSWIAGGSAAVLLAAGYWLGGQIIGRRPRDAGPPEMVQPVRAFVSPGIAAPSNEAAPPPEERLTELGISPREYEVLHLVADGLSNQEIADRLYISESTVKSHVSSLLAKLEAKRRTHAVRRARHLGLIGEPLVRK